MSTLIQKAQKGNKEAMQMLYHNNKGRVLFLCTLLLDHTNVACDATSRIFRQMWELTIAGRIESEDEFSKVVMEKAVNYCKVSISRKSAKAFRIPENKNFAGVNYSSDKLKNNEDFSLFLVRNFPPLHRFIYVLHALYHGSTSDIAKMFKMSDAVMELALNAEEANMKRLLLLNEQYAGEMHTLSVEDFHRHLRDIGIGMSVPEYVDTAVMIDIDTACKPLALKAKKRRRTFIICIGAAILCACMIGFSVWYVTGAAEGDETTAADTEDIASVDEGTTSYLYTPDALDGNLTYYADIKIDNYGTITVKLDQSAAPITAANFVSLANEGFYDGLTFHRIVEGFVMQGGDPQGDGYGGHTDEDGREMNIVGEFSDNGYENNLSHTAGAISMARGNDYDSASSQFFIVHTDDYIDSLDGQYAVFGYVTEGMDIVNAICEATYTIEDGVIKASEQPVITSITIRTVENDSETVADSEDESDGAVDADDMVADSETDTETDDTVSDATEVETGSTGAETEPGDAEMTT